LAGALVACAHCDENIELPAKTSASDAPTVSLSDLTGGLGQTATYACPHCGQTLLTARTLQHGHACARCGKGPGGKGKAARADADDMLRFECAGCNKRLKAPPDAAGKKASCRRCGLRLRVPKLRASSSPFVFV
jgi:DNA-directed RNA polymerase subunit RPC12/RpoP